MADLRGKNRSRRNFYNTQYVLSQCEICQQHTYFYLNKILMNSFHALNQIVFLDFVSERQTRCFFRRAYVTFSELIEQSPCGINARSGFYRSAQRGRARTRPPSPSPSSPPGGSDRGRAVEVKGFC